KENPEEGQCDPIPTGQNIDDLVVHDRQAAENHIRVCLAGPVAETMFCFGRESDIEGVIVSDCDDAREAKAIIQELYRCDVIESAIKRSQELGGPLPQTITLDD